MWYACERMSILPPGIKPAWDDNDVWAQASLVAWQEIRAKEESGG